MSGTKDKVWHQLTIADQSFCTKKIWTKLLVCISQHIANCKRFEWNWDRGIPNESTQKFASNNFNILMVFKFLNCIWRERVSVNPAGFSEWGLQNLGFSERVLLHWNFLSAYGGKHWGISYEGLSITAWPSVWVRKESQSQGTVHRRRGKRVSPGLGLPHLLWVS